MDLHHQHKTLLITTYYLEFQSAVESITDEIPIWTHIMNENNKSLNKSQQIVLQTGQLEAQNSTLHFPATWKYKIDTTDLILKQ